MQYECTRGHGVTTPEPLTVDACLACTREGRCDGDLRAHGDGSREENHRLAGLRRAQKENAA